MQSAQTQNQGIITELIAFRDKVNAVPPKDWSALSQLISEISASGIVDPVDAVDLRNQLETRLTNLKQRISDTLQLFNQYVSIC